MANFIYHIESYSLFYIINSSKSLPDIHDLQIKGNIQLMQNKNYIKINADVQNKG